MDTLPKFDFQTIDLSSRVKDLVKFRIPTGIIAIDKVVGGGIPAGKLTEIYGGWSSGKTRLACHVIAQTQKLGGVGVFADNERSLDEGLIGLTGIDTDPTKFIYPDPDTELTSVENIFRIMQNAVVTLRENNPEGLLTIVWDSVASTPGIQELEGEMGVNTTAMRRAKLIGEGLRRLMTDVYRHKVCLIFINQIRDRIGIMYGEKTDTVGGKALKFTASLRLHCKIAGRIKNEKTGELEGYKGKLIVDKSKICKPFGVVNFPMYADKPIDKHAGLLDYMSRHGEVLNNKGWYSFPDTPETKFRESDFPTLYEKRELKGE